MAALNFQHESSRDIITHSICAIIPTYNRSAMLRECIDSVLAQTLPVQEIIVVNDGSTDDTETVAQSYGDRVTLVNKPNGGKASALNLGLANCTSDYVWICDDDDIAAPDGLEHLATALAADDEADFVFGDFLAFTSHKEGYSIYDSGYRRRVGEPNAKILFLEEMFTYQYAMLARRSAYEKIGPFREDLIRSQDYEMAIRISRNAKAIDVPKVIFYQRQHSGVRGSANDLFSADMKEQKWLSYDQSIFESIKENYDLEEFTPTFALSWKGNLAKRATLLERACIFANRALWNDAINDLEHAARVCLLSATPEEINLAEAIVKNPLSWKILDNNSDWKYLLHDCYTRSNYGRSIISALCRPLVWHSRALLKKGNIGPAMKMLRMLVQILGIRGAFLRILNSAFNL